MSTLDDPFDTLLLEDEVNGVARDTKSSAAPSAAAAGVATARFYGFDLADRPVVTEVPGLPGELVAARSTVALIGDHIGLPVVIVFEQGDPRRPIVLGVILEPTADAELSLPKGSVGVRLDDSRVVLSAEREIVLQCGKASITLTRAGKVLIRGEYVSSRSGGVNRIKGGSVQIN
jgi:hypothetical protein